MGNLINKLAFGFVMAQLFPGVIVLASLSFFYLLFAMDQPESFSSVSNQVFQFWTGSLGKQMSFVGLSTVFGMAIHGLHWSVLGLWEKYREPLPASLAWYENRPLIMQWLLSPVYLVWQSGVLLFKAEDWTDAILEENVPFIPDKKMEAFQFLQDFYLHFAQFYIHTSYALVLAFGCLLTGTIKLGCSIWGFGALTVLYLFAGFFFMAGRIQFGSLFEAEESLKENKRKK